MKEHMKSLGFHNVYNACEDFYGLIREGRVPVHDVLVTNPPYADAHVQRLLRFCRAHDKPYLLLMPDIYLSSLATLTVEPGRNGSIGDANDAHQQESTKKTKSGWAEGLIYLCPTTRYWYWTPKGLRGDEDTDNRSPLARVVIRLRGRKSSYTHDNDIELGRRTSPLASLWHVDFQSVCTRHEFIETARLLAAGDCTNGETASVRLCTSVEHVRKLLRAES